ncbi:MAG: exodeoxyribonuclease VII small subunit [Halanaerobiaceae bacterium]|nr:exodeoxyribonuclease VII small subunit [Halanaerobiaceae bacterium]
MSQKKLSFEEALKKLEETVKALEDGGLSLDKSLELFTEGVQLVKFCNEELNKAEKKIEMVLESEEGFADTVPFVQEEEFD